VGGVNCNNFAVSITTIDASCYTCTDGSATATVSGGTSPYSYSWSPSGGTLSVASNLAVGNYYCIVTDSNGCTATSVGYVGPDACSAYFTLYPDTNIAHLYWAINYATGAQPLHYNWAWGDTQWNTGDTAAYPSHQYANAGVYTICLMITDANGCTNSYCITDSILRTTNTMVQVNVISPHTATGIKEGKSSSSLTIFPNPANQILNITYNSKAQLIITDVIGNKIYEQSLNTINNNIDVSKWSKGIYFLKIMNDQESVVRKIVID
jgi:PKD repeat protein